MMSKNIVDLRQYFQTTFFDKVLQNLTNFLSNYVEICFMLTKFTGKKCCRKLLAKNIVEKCCWIKLQQFFSTNFYNPGATSFVKYQTKICSKNVCRILQKNINFCRNLQHFSEKNCSFVSIYSKKRWRILLVNFLTSTKKFSKKCC